MQDACIAARASATTAIPAGGSNVREVLLRGVGPKLSDFGVPSVLQAARLEVFRADGVLLARTNTIEPSAADAAERIGAFPLARAAGDAAVMLTLRPGNYTARLSGIEGATGIGLIELYEADQRSDRLTNISSRVQIGPGVDEVAIAGFVVGGTVPKRVLARASGPALTAFGVTGVIANPRLEIRDSSGRVVATNDDWQSQTDAATIGSVGAAVGAFPFAAGSQDAAIVTLIPPGTYAAVVSGDDVIGGVGLVEIYEVR